MEFPEARELPAAESDEQPEERAAAQPECNAPDPEESFAARLEEARRTIVAEARQEMEREVRRARERIAGAVEQFTQQREEYFRQAEGEVVRLALAIARRLLHRESQIDPRLLAGLVNFELSQLEAATSVRLCVAPDELAYWKSSAQALAREVELVGDQSLAAGELRIESALGTTTLSFERELKEIEQGFFDLLAHRPQSAAAESARVQ
jgi:flagellar assembly protein FliH